MKNYTAPVINVMKFKQEETIMQMSAVPGSMQDSFGDGSFTIQGLTS